jgi:hypothetical protein
VVLRLQKPETAAALRDVVQVVGHLVREVVDLVDDSRDEQESDPDERCKGGEIDDGRRRTSTPHTVLQTVDRRVQG